MGGACGTYGGVEKCVVSFGGGTLSGVSRVTCQDKTKYLHYAEFLKRRQSSATLSFVEIHWTRRFITVFTTVCHWPRFWTTWILILWPYPCNILVLSSHLLLDFPNDIFVPNLRTHFTFLQLLYDTANNSKCSAVECCIMCHHVCRFVGSYRRIHHVLNSSGSRRK